MLELPIEEILAAPRELGSPIGASREDRPVYGLAIGAGTVRISLIAGCHADEPVGPAMLERFAGWLASRPAEHPALRDVHWRIVAHANPDGEARNESWTTATLPTTDHIGAEDRGYDLAAYVQHVVRELPGDDVEFGFPRSDDDSGARPENRAIAAFLAGGAPLALHASFHGMGFALGPWFLLDPFWLERSRPLRQRLAARVTSLGYDLHEVDRGGEKGFWRIERGFSTRPDSRSMRDFFLARGDLAVADLFRPSSMEHVRGLGGDPFTMVSEMPLFLLPDEGPLADPALPRRDRLHLLDSAVIALGPRAAASLGVLPMPIRDQMRLQLALLDEGLALLPAPPR